MSAQQLDVEGPLSGRNTTVRALRSPPGRHDAARPQGAVTRWRWHASGTPVVLNSHWRNDALSGCTPRDPAPTDIRGSQLKRWAGHAALTPRRFPALTPACPLARSPEVKPGDVISVKVDWCVRAAPPARRHRDCGRTGSRRPTAHHPAPPPPLCRVMANELTLVGITDMWKKFEKPKVFNKERVWLAVDHTVDPRIVSAPAGAGAARARAVGQALTRVHGGCPVGPLPRPLRAVPRAQAGGAHEVIAGFR